MSGLRDRTKAGPPTSDLPAPALTAEGRFLAVITSGDGEFIVPHRADDIAGKILATKTIATRRFAVEETDFAPELHLARRAQIYNAVDRALVVRRNVSRAQRSRWIEGGQKFRSRPHRTECAGEKELIPIFKRRPG